MVRFFQLTPPTAHQMILTLERRGFITRTPGEARSIRLKLSPQELPSLQGTATATNIPLPARQNDGQQPTDLDAAILRLGKIQIGDLLAYNGRSPLDDSEFISLLNTLIESFVRAGLSALRVKELRRHAGESHHRCCQEAEPESTVGWNMERMFSYLPGPPRPHWQRWI
jgi:hypothetical protein